MRTFALVILASVLACTSRHEPRPREEVVASREDEVAAPSVAPPMPPPAPTPDVGTAVPEPAALAPEPAPTTASVVEDLAIALSDPACGMAEVRLSCGDAMAAGWLVGAGAWDRKVPCVAAGEVVTTISTQGVASRTVMVNARRPGADPVLARSGEPVPEDATLWLVTKRRAPAPTARIERRAPGRAKPARKKLAAWVIAQVRGLPGSELPVVRARALDELPGRFGGEGDAVVRFEITTDAEGYSYEVAVVVAGDRPVALLPFVQPEMFGVLVPYGVVDLDGDGVEEVVWWAQHEEMSALYVSYFAGERHAVREVWSNSGSGYYFLWMHGRPRCERGGQG